MDIPSNPRKHGQVSFYLTQALSGHGCFKTYPKRFQKRDDESCSYCYNAEHTLFVCARWGMAREAVGRAVSAQLTHDTMVSRMLQSEQKYPFLFIICHPRDKDEEVRWACGERQQRGPVEIASGPAPAVLRPGGTWLSASFGGGILLYLPWLAQLVGLPKGRAAADGSPGRTDDGRAVRDFKLELRIGTFFSISCIFWLKNRIFHF